MAYSILAVLFQDTAYVAFFHTLTASFLVSGAAVAAVSGWMMTKNRQFDLFRPAAKLGAWVILVSAVLVSVSGDMDMKVMVAQQPMKVAAAEAQYATQESAPFSILSVGGLSGDSATNVLEVPGLLSWLATGNWSGASSTAQGINDLTAPYVATYGPGNYVPYVPVTYCGFRLMIGLGMLAPLYALIALWAFRGGRIPKNRLFALFNSVIPLFPLFPLFGISAGWIFTELGRQPWIVFGQQLTALVQWLPLGMDTDVGVLGVAVSGGEGQRRALARLLLARVRFVVLDEPTEHIDAATAGSLVATTTTLLITHRLTELGVVDRIIELQDGRIAAEGSHPALMALEGWYAEQWQAESDLRGMAQNVPTLRIGIAVAGPAA